MAGVVGGGGRGWFSRFGGILFEAFAIGERKSHHAERGGSRGTDTGGNRTAG